ncbi:MAG TPA: bacterioferritin-associated ferredoxin [Spongiibacteraceae bacterium]|nr:bacterioferritin-associated ferredoxin [Spongiibacteraceae bacterium]
MILICTIFPPSTTAVRRVLFMYVCLCKGITDSQIRNAVADGTTSYRELRQTLGLSSQCGRCAVQAREIFREALPALHNNTSLFYSAAGAVA